MKKCLSEFTSRISMYNHFTRRSSRTTSNRERIGAARSEKEEEENSSSIEQPGEATFNHVASMQTPPKHGRLKEELSIRLRLRSANLDFSYVVCWAKVPPAVLEEPFIVWTQKSMHGDRVGPLNIITAEDIKSRPGTKSSCLATCPWKPNLVIYALISLSVRLFLWDIKSGSFHV